MEKILHLLEWQQMVALHFKTSGSYCNDYTPDPLAGQHTYTLYPFWTDLIRDNGSVLLARNFYR